MSSDNFWLRKCSRNNIIQYTTKNEKNIFLKILKKSCNFWKNLDFFSFFWKTYFSEVTLRHAGEVLECFRDFPSNNYALGTLLKHLVTKFQNLKIFDFFIFFSSGVDPGQHLGTQRVKCAFLQHWSQYARYLFSFGSKMQILEDTNICRFLKLWKFCTTWSTKTRSTNSFFTLLRLKKKREMFFNPSEQYASNSSTRQIYSFWFVFWSFLFNVGLDSWAPTLSPRLGLLF